MLIHLANDASPTSFSHITPNTHRFSYSLKTALNPNPHHYYLCMNQLSRRESVMKRLVKNGFVWEKQRCITYMMGEKNQKPGVLAHQPQDLNTMRRDEH